MSVSGSAAQLTLTNGFARAQRVVVDRLRDELLAGPRLAADEDGRVGAGDLHHLFAHLPHRAARAEDVREVVALAQLVAQPHVLVHEALPVGFDERLHLERLRQHRADDAVELRRPVVVAVASERQLDLEHAPALPRLLHRHADVGQVVVFESAAPARRHAGPLACGRGASARAMCAESAGSWLTRGTTSGRPLSKTCWASVPPSGASACGARMPMEACR